jgi:hypothetical protein
MSKSSLIRRGKRFAFGGLVTLSTVWLSMAGCGGSSPSGTGSGVTFVFRNNAGDELLFNLNWIEFLGQGVSQ